MDIFLVQLENKINEKYQEIKEAEFSLEYYINNKGLHHHALIKNDLVNNQEYLDSLQKYNFIEDYEYDRNVEIAKAVWEEVRLEYNAYRKQFENIDVEDFNEYLQPFSEWLYKHFASSQELNVNKFYQETNRFNTQCIDNIFKGYKYVSDPENNELVYFQSVMNGVWTLIQIGLAEEALVILNYMRHDYHLFLQGNKESMFQFLDSTAHIPRMGQSLDWAFAWAFRQLENNERQAFYLNSIISRHPVYCQEERLKIFWHTGVYRILEAAVQLYRIEPTEENKTKIRSIINYNNKMHCEEHYESLREALMSLHISREVFK